MDNSLPVHLQTLPNLDAEVLEQIISLDDDQESYEFTHQLIGQFFVQSKQTIENIKVLM